MSKILKCDKLGSEWPKSSKIQVLLPAIWCPHFPFSLEASILGRSKPSVFIAPHRRSAAFLHLTIAWKQWLGCSYQEISEVFSLKFWTSAEDLVKITSRCSGWPFFLNLLHPFNGHYSWAKSARHCGAKFLRNHYSIINLMFFCVKQWSNEVAEAPQMSRFL